MADPDRSDEEEEEPGLTQSRTEHARLTDGHLAALTKNYYNKLIYTKKN